MSEKYNDEKVKEMLESEKVPERLEPENIKKMLDSGNYAEKRRKIRHRKILRIVSAAAAFAVVFGTSVYFMKPTLYKLNDYKTTEVSVNSGTDKDEPLKTVPIASMKTAEKYGDVYGYFYTANLVNNFKDFFTGGGFMSESSIEIMEDAVAEEAPMENGAFTNKNESMDTGSADDAVAGGGESENKEFSDTYSQETGVLEADIVKTDGNSIFYSTRDELCIAKTDKGKFINPHKTDVSEELGLSVDGCINDMYIYGEKLVVICDFYDYNKENRMYDGCWYGSYSDTYVVLFDISSEPKLSGYYVQEGNYNDVRLMEDGYLYLVTSDEKYLDYRKTGRDDVEAYIPQYRIGEEKCLVEPADIMIPTSELEEVYNYVSYTNVAGLNLNSENPCQPVDVKSIAGYANNIYCSKQNLYVVSGYDESEITRFAVNDGMIEPQASGKVKGYVKDQFSMSEYNGYFRIAVTENTWEERKVFAETDSAVESNTMVSQKNSLYVLDMDMNVVGSIGDFGINEQIKSVNFNGDTAYVVTFRQTDPLFAFDLSNPAKPVMLDEFKISGYSSYMQKWSEGILLGFGVEADEQTGWETGIKLTMFDNSDPNNLKEIDTAAIYKGDTGYVSSEGVYKRKALFIDPEKNIIGFPVEKYYENYYDDYSEIDRSIEQSYQFYSFENGKLVYRGELKKSNCSNDYEYYENFRRVVYIDGYLYAVSADEFKSADAKTFAEVDRAVFS